MKGVHRSSRSWSFAGLVATLSAALLLCGPSKEAAPTSPETVQGSALSPDGRWEATTTRAIGSKLGTVLLSDSESESVHSAEVPGDVRSVLFSPNTDRIYVLSGRKSRFDHDEVHLWASEIPELDFKRVTRVASNSTALGFWTEENALLVAGPNQVRTLLLGGTRSGPLFAVPGDNRTLASVGGGSLTLIGQDFALLLVDLSDPPERDSMPVRERWPVDAAVLSIEVSLTADRARVALQDGSSWILGLADRSWNRVEPAEPVSSRTFATVQPSTYVRQRAEPVSSASAPTDAMDPADALDPTESIPAKELEPERAPSPISVPSPSPTIADLGPGPDTPDAVDEVSNDQPPAPRRSHDPTRSEQPANSESDEPPLTTEPAADLPSAMVAGTVYGLPKAQPVALIFMGPNNLLQEHTRVSLLDGSDGGWAVMGLPPGRYRVQLDGGGSKILITEPRFHTVEIVEGQPGNRIDFRILRVR